MGALGTSAIEHILSLTGAAREIGFVAGNFNVLHPGHLRLLKFAAEVGDFLIVGVNTDSTPGVTVPGHERLANVAALSIVNHAVLLEESVTNFIAKLKPSIVFKGKEFENRHNAELAVVQSYGGRLIFGSGEMVFSSFSLLDDEFAKADHSAIVKPTDYLQRHSFEMADLIACLRKFSGAKAVVIGDLIIDEYITCDPIGMSQEDPAIVVTPIETKTFVGGAGVVAAHARGLGADVNFFTVTGPDEGASFASHFLQNRGIIVHALTDDTRPTILKQRYRAAGKTMLRVNHQRQHPISQHLSSKLLERVDDHLSDADVVLFSDFNYGCLPQPLVDAIIERAAAHKVLMVADSQASSQISDISRFKGMGLITPTEREARLSLRDGNSGLAVIAANLITVSCAGAAVITLGSEGLLIYAKKGDQYLMDRLPAFNHAPKDVAGAGDSLFATTSLALCTGADVWMSVYLGALAAGCQVGRVGNAPLQIGDLLSEVGGTNCSTGPTSNESLLK